MKKQLIINAFADEASDHVDGQIAALKRNDLDGIEIRNFGNKSICDHTEEEVRELKRKFDSAGLKIGAIGSPIGKIDIETDDFNVHIEKFKHTLELATILETEKIRIFSFYIPNGKSPNAYKNEVIDRLGLFLELAKGSGVSLCHENEKGIYGDIAARCLDIHKSLPEMKGIFDPANYIQCGQNTMDAWNCLKGYIDYLHIKDAVDDGSVVPAGKGAGCVCDIVSEYIAMGGNKFTIEPHLTVFSGLSNLERECETSSIGKKYLYPDADTAFDAACSAFNELLRGIC